MKHLALAAALLLSALPARAEFVGHGGPVKGLGVSADGAVMVSASFDYSIIRWSLTTGEAMQVLFGHDAAVNAVALLPDGRFLSASDDGTLAVWAPDREQPDARLTGHGGRIAAVTLSPDGKLAASAAWDRTVRLWDIAAGRELRVLEGHEGTVNAVAFTPDGAMLASVGADGTLRLWRVADGVQVAQFGGGPVALNSVAIHPDASRIFTATADGRILSWLLPDGKPGPELAAPLRSPLLGLALSPDGTLLAAAGIDGGVNVWSVAEGEVRHRFAGDRGPVWSLAFTPDGATLLSGGNDRMIRQWNLATGLEIDAPTSVRLVEPDPHTQGNDPGVQAWRRCVACHTLTPDGGNRAGPTLHNIFGRRMGTLPGYPYSPALLKADIIWTEETVAKLFELGPDVVTPGTKMPIQRIPDPGERAALIAFLREHAMEK